MRSLVVVALLVLLAPAVSAESVVTVTGNPHMAPVSSGKATSADDMETCAAGGGSMGGAFNSLLNPSLIIQAPLPTQPDTFLKLHVKKIAGGIAAPIYQFKQPARLSHLELPFKILPMLEDPAAKLQYNEIPVPMAQAVDSWFVGHYWSIIVAEGCDGKLTHLGWKFTPVAGGNTASAGFLALIVDYVDTEAEATGSIREQLLAGELNIGVQAPAWMAALFLTVRQS